MSVLHVFDMDGTLLRGSSASLQIGRATGTVEQVAALEAAFVAGRIDTVGFAEGVHRLWRGLTLDLVARVYAGSPWLTGIREVCADIRRRGERSAVITMSPDFFARLLLEEGVDEVVASRFPSVPFVSPVDPAGILTPADKVRIVEELCARHGLPLSRCVAYGDSISDGPLFAHLGATTVAVNADATLAAVAARAYAGEDLLGAYALGRSLIDPTPLTPPP
ncbi:HAD-IB family phosphatase [Asanoa sp. WMMD1127]|uniref:HAD family hydrolase n=1 Tax=Asanoa sp. WMMD1127 TaxID=3016107 RepID=UPI0024169489|nr:HAD-IB family phosphatase [Asanoa sp. WMMD1127]MDG4823705.1 HAD-IB family phosphatase [Asanoa sp. WMMD1127]